MIPVHMISRLHAAIVAAGVAIEGVDIDGKVQPSSLQSAAQPTIDAFDQSEAAHATWLANQEPSIRDLRADAETAVSNNETFLLDGNVTNAEAVVQLKAVTRQMNRVIPLLLRVIVMLGR